MTKAGLIYENTNEYIARYNKFRKSHQGVTFTHSELKTEFEKLGIPGSWYYWNSLLRFKLMLKPGHNKYVLPSEPIYKARLTNALRHATKVHKAA